MKGADLRTVLRGRDFRRLYATRLVSQLTDGVFQVALAGYVFFSPERQTSATAAAAAFATLLLPYSVLGPFVGVFIDRWSRRQILLVAPLLRAACTVGVAALLAAGQDGAPFYLAALLVLGINRFFLSALSAALPHVVTREQLVLANALSVTSGTIITFVGAGIGYGLRRLLGAGSGDTAAILLCAAGIWLLTAVVAATLDRRGLGPDLDEAPRRTREALGNVLHGLLDGLRHLRERPPAALALGVISVHRFLYGITLIMTLLLFRNHFTTDAEAGLAGFATALGVSGAGFFVGAVITPPVVRRIAKETWITALLLSGSVVLLVFGPPFAEPLWLAGAFGLGVVSQGVKLCVDTILQESVADAYRGRVFSAYDMLFNATFVAAAAAAAATVPVSGRSYPVLLAVVVAYALTAAAYRTLSRRRTPSSV
ncbi:MFS transporter [Actinomadura craniellae]|uniref:MFS transporter n=1 Tax=Actinomadura craniellae TaxID=2231787 RepID=A0A365H6V9_9ACTN|nr:MFS transporter [Actinomadura craniellae]RAY14732.1 MFS transporter [Actinomadura craniellae]